MRQLVENTPEAAIGHLVYREDQVERRVVNDPGGFVILLVPDNVAVTTGVLPNVSLPIPHDLDDSRLQPPDSLALFVFGESSSGSVEVQLIRDRAGVQVDMLDDLLTIEAGDFNSFTATPATLDVDDLLRGDRILFEVVSAGTGVLGLDIAMVMLK